MFASIADRKCEACIVGKQTPLPYRISLSRVKRPLELVISAVAFVEVESVRHKYFVMLLDWYIHFNVVC